MAYKKQNFVKDQVLEAEHLNHIEDGIVENETALDNKQPKGNYLTAEQANETYQPKGEYQPKGNYVTKETADQTYQPKGSYLTEHQKLKTINGQSVVGEGNIEIKTDLPTEEWTFTLEDDSTVTKKVVVAE